MLTPFETASFVFLFHLAKQGKKGAKKYTQRSCEKKGKKNTCGFATPFNFLLLSINFCNFLGLKTGSNKKVFHNYIFALKPLLYRALGFLFLFSSFPFKTPIPKGF